jgi:hypothetical protein
MSCSGSTPPATACTLSGTEMRGRLREMATIAEPALQGRRRASAPADAQVLLAEFADAFVPGSDTA